MENNFKNYKMSQVPIVTNYKILSWENGFENWKLVRIYTPPDGSCLFHALFNSFYKPYGDQCLNSNFISSDNIVKCFRHELSIFLDKYYYTINNGNIAHYSEYVPEFTIDNMKKILDSHEYVGYGYIGLLSEVLDKDIYILNGDTQNLYISDELTLNIKGNRPSIVLYYQFSHYELIAICDNDYIDFKTHLSPSNSFIKFLYSLLTK